MSIPYEILLHPELLSNDQLISIILERHLRIPNIEQMHREQLLELFHNFCVPFGQRKSRDIGRWKSQEHTSNNFSESIEPSHNNRKHFLQINEGVKPPPDILSGHLKRIKINGHADLKNGSSSMQLCPNKRKIESQESTMSTSPPPAKKERKPISWP